MILYDFDHKHATMSGFTKVRVSGFEALVLPTVSIVLLVLGYWVNSFMVKALYSNRVTQTKKYK